MNEAEILRLINKERESRGLTPLVSDGELQNAAESKAEDMASNAYFAHKSPSGLTFSDVLRMEGYSYKLAAENIAVNSDPYAIVSAWMASPGHRANILNPAFNATGVGLFKGIYQNRQITFAAQIFAKTEIQQKSIEIVDVQTDKPVIAPSAIPTPSLTAPAPPSISSNPHTKPVQDESKEVVRDAKSKLTTKPSTKESSEVSGSVTSSLPSSTAFSTTTIASDPATSAIVRMDQPTNHPSEFLFAPALLAVAAIASLKLKLPILGTKRDLD